MSQTSGAQLPSEGLKAGPSTTADKKVQYTITAEDGASITIPESQTIGVLKLAEQHAPRLLYVTLPEDDSSGIPTFHAADLPTSSQHDAALTAVPAFLTRGASQTHVLVSTLSGSQTASKIYTALLRPFLSALGFHETTEYTVHHTETARSVADFARTTLQSSSEPHTVILLSGDGGIVEIVNALRPTSAESSTPVVCLIPTGTGNALANSTNILPSPSLGLKHLLHGSPVPVPLFRVRFSPPARPYEPSSDGSNTAAATAELSSATGAVVFSWGLHASLVADSDTPAYRKHGAARFRMAATENLFPPDGSPAHAYRGKLSFKRSGQKDRQWTDVGERSEHAYVLATFCARLEANFTIAPDAAALESVLRLVHFGPMPNGGHGAMEVMGKAYQGGAHVGMPGVGYEKVDALKLVIHETEERWRRICVDGSIYVVPAGGTVEVGTDGVDEVVKLVHWRE